jgi:hypothetical protein
MKRLVEGVFTPRSFITSISHQLDYYWDKHIEKCGGENVSHTRQKKNTKKLSI